jgi:hypothetical protein
METNIIYKYRDPHAPSGNESTLTTKIEDLNPYQVMTEFHPIGETVILEADNSQEYSEGLKECVVVDRHPLLTQWGAAGYTASILIVVVTDAVT